ncbi:uncharacterized protein LOC133193092 [Saccostrea echinata]|uniref:uncharacterized protein LOC133193092 n=1 Tax=Saccostrea echinata TaxID=191078 RepID=UPI002A8247E0|nr:uncharacterized protein LOC133193092 [Saccostrea echinata]
MRFFVLSPLPSSDRVVVLQPERREVSRIDISFKEGSGISSSPVFDVYLGDRFYMFITYTGEHHVIKPEECKAFSGTVVDESSENVTLWDKRSCYSSKNNILMDNFTQMTPQVLRAPLYGFHFVSSSYVTIECTVRICRQNTTCDKSICAQKRKRRRRKDPFALGSSSFQVLNGNRIPGGADTIPVLHRFTLGCMVVMALSIKTPCI